MENINYSYLMRNNNPFIDKKENLKEVEYFENKFNLSLPFDYKEFINEYNGGLLNYGFENNIINNLPFIGLDEFLSLKEIMNSIGTSGLEYYDRESLNIDYWHQNKILKLKLLPFITNSGGTCEGYIGFGNENYGKIYAVNLEFLSDKDYGLNYVCNSFTEFMNGFEKIPNCEE